MGSQYRELVLGAEFMDLLDEPEATVIDTDIAPLCEALIGNMATQRSVYGEYLAVTEKQKFALVNNRLTENQKINDDSDRLLSALANLETERLGIAERILAARPDLAPSANALRCEALCAILEPGLSGRLVEARTGLRKMVETLQAALKVNSALVENGSRIIHTTIGIITSVVGRTRTDNMGTYTKKGAVNLGKVQIRNLINRSV